jgi:hypothetical protein
MKTFKAATTSRAPFSEAEESMDSNSNDDRLSWQEVCAEARKKHAQEPQKCQL